LTKSAVDKLCDTCPSIPWFLLADRKVALMLQCNCVSCRLTFVCVAYAWGIKWSNDMREYDFTFRFQE